MRKISDLQALHALYGKPVPLALDKVVPRLTPQYRAWIEGSRFCVLATVGDKGVHATPRGDDGPVVVVEDDATLLMPDWRGNNRLDALRDIVLDGRVALLFMVPGSKTTVRVNANAWLTDDAALRDRFENGKGKPATVLVFDILEIYTQCAKAFLRSGLWLRDDADTVPTAGEIMADLAREPLSPTYDKDYDERAKSRMW